MKKLILTALTIFLVIMAGLNFATAQNITNETGNSETESEIVTRTVEEEESKSRIGENVTSLQGGYYNVSFDDGYNGFCVNHGLHSTNSGEKFTVKDTSSITSNIYEGESVGNYLKILFTEFHNHTMHPDTNIAQAVWAFTDGHYKTNDDPIVRQILEMDSNGLTVNDHGEVIKINNTTEALFDFEALDSHSQSTQNFFGYKITYRDILEVVENNTLLGTPENNTILNQTPEENNTELNQTPKENTTNENNTELNQTPKENTTDNTTQPKDDNNLNETPIEETENATADINNEKTSATAELIKHATGNPIFLLLAMILSSVGLIKIRRD